MRVCQITSMHSWDDDRIYQRACLGLVNSGYEVHLIAVQPDKLPSESKVRLHWLKFRIGWKRRWFSSKEAVDKAIKINADVYHFHDPDLLPHIRKLKVKCPRSKVFYDIHENYVARFKMWGLPSFIGRLFRMFEIFIIRHIDGYTITSHSMKELFTLSNRPSCVVYNSINLLRLEKLNINDIQPAYPPVIYTSGTHSHSRNCIETIRAMNYMNKEIPFQMMFVGRYVSGIEREMKAQSTADGTIKYLRLEEMLPWEDNFKRTSEAFLGCVFYAENSNNRVTIPNRLFEYMYCGIPVVATDFPELRNIIEKTKCGLLVNSDNPRDIAKIFEFLLKNPQKALEMGRRGRKAIESEYNFNMDLRRLINLYQETV